jgi:uncharacterized membrane protein YphA (DoxX/SURF4 family)
MITRWLNESPRISLTWMALLRIMLGLLFLTQWGNNIVDDLYSPEGLRGLFNYYFTASSDPILWYHALIDRAILPIAPLFAAFQFGAELLIGVGLLVGALTPLVSLGAGFFILNTFLLSWGADWPWSYLTILSILGAIFFTRAGRALGVDAWLVKRFGEKALPLW